MKISKLFGIGALALLGCKNETPIKDYSYSGQFNGMPVSIGS